MAFKKQNVSSVILYILGLYFISLVRFFHLYYTSMLGYVAQTFTKCSIQLEM